MNLTKKLGVLLLIFLMVNSLTSVAARSGKDDKLKAKKVAFFTQKLNLNSDEAEIFWPVYNEYQEKKDDLFQQRKSIYDDFKGASRLSNKEVGELLTRLTQIAKDEASLLESYIAKFKEILPDKKVAQLFVVEEDYKKFLLIQIRNSAIK